MSARRASPRKLVLVVVLAGLLALVGPVAGAHAGVMTGLVRVAPATAQTSAAKSLTAVCPTGTRVIGVGADTTPGNGSVLIDRMQPNAALTAVTVHATEDEHGTPATWYLQAFLVCANPPPGLQLITATSPPDSAAKSVVASCPTGQRLLGNAAALTGATGQVLLDGQTPSTGLTSVNANALEDQTGTTADWSITAYAICANPVTGLQRIAVTGASDSNANKVVAAPCPAGKSVIGLAGTINSPNGQVVLDALFPDVGLTSGNISAFEDADGDTANWSLTANAICAASVQLVTSTSGRKSFMGTVQSAGCPTGQTAVGGGASIEAGLGRVAIWQSMASDVGTWQMVAVTSPLANVDASVTAQAICATPFTSQGYASANSPQGSPDEQTATVTCPAGRRVIGAGGSVNGVDNVMLEAIRPNSALTSVTAIGHETESGSSNDWDVAAFAICASPPLGLRLVTTSSAPESDDFAQAIATCPAGTHLIGTGGEIVGGAGQVLLDGLKADAALTKTTVVGFEDQTGYDPDYHATAYAICINR